MITSVYLIEERTDAEPEWELLTSCWVSTRSRAVAVGAEGCATAKGNGIKGYKFRVIEFRRRATA